MHARYFSNLAANLKQEGLKQAFHMGCRENNRAQHCQSGSFKFYRVVRCIVCVWGAFGGTNAFWGPVAR